MAKGNKPADDEEGKAALKAKPAADSEQSLRNIASDALKKFDSALNAEKAAMSGGDKTQISSAKESRMSAASEYTTARVAQLQKTQDRLSGQKSALEAKVEQKGLTDEQRSDAKNQLMEKDAQVFYVKSQITKLDKHEDNSEKLFSDDPKKTNEAAEALKRQNNKIANENKKGDEAFNNLGFKERTKFVAKKTVEKAADTIDKPKPQSASGVTNEGELIAIAIYNTMMLLFGALGLGGKSVKGGADLVGKGFDKIQGMLGGGDKDKEAIQGEDVEEHEAALEETLTNAREKIEELEGGNIGLEAQKADLKGEIHVLGKDIKKLKADLEANLGNVDLTKELKSKEEELEGKKSELAGVEAEIQRNDDEIDTLKGAIEEGHNGQEIAAEHKVTLAVKDPEPNDAEFSRKSFLVGFESKNANKNTQQEDESIKENKPEIRRKLKK